MQNVDIIIIGAGAAGLMCAGIAGKRGRRVLVLDRATKPGQKIAISGGGRANFTNLQSSPSNFLSSNPRFCVSALKRYSPIDFVELVNKHGIAWHEREHGQLFCKGPARQITDMLLREASGAILRLSTNVASITKGIEQFVIYTDQGSFSAGSLVIATGGPSIPKMGSSGFGYDMARQFGLRVVEPRPGLVPFKYSGFADLAGVSIQVTVKLGKVSFSEALLFTHRGLSGPVILQISSYWRKGDTLTIDLLPGQNVYEHLQQAKSNQPKKEVQSVISRLLPKRLAQKLVREADCEGRLGEVSDKSLRRLSDAIKAWKITPEGTEGLRTAEVTVGGVDTRELSSKTMQARSVPGLYFIGETVDVTGHLGGFNFQWAWASGHACGLVA